MENNIKYLFEKDLNGAYIRLIIPSNFVKLILGSDNDRDIDLRGKKDLDLTSDEVIVLKKYAYELIENKEVNDMNNNITFEKAKEMATEEASKHGKIIETIEENDEYWLFKAGFEDGHRDFDDGIGSIYISKVDGSTRGLNLWDMDFTRKFKESAKVIYNYPDNK